MFVILQSYNERNIERQKELLFVILKLLQNPYITRVVDLSESVDTTPPGVYDKIKNHPNYTYVPKNEWLTYNRVIQYGLKELPKGEPICLLNNDIFLGTKDHWKQVSNYIDTLQKVHSKPVVLTFTRHEWGGSEATSTLDPQFVRTMGSNSQDVWIWKNGSIQPHSEYDIPIGILGCDNAIAHRFHEYGGIIPYNLGLRWRVYHYDICRNKSAGTALNYHIRHEKQKSRGFEQRGALTVPFINKVPYIIDTAVYFEEYREPMRRIKEFSKQYEIFLKIQQKSIVVRNE